MGIKKRYVGVLFNLVIWWKKNPIFDGVGCREHLLKHFFLLVFPQSLSPKDWDTLSSSIQQKPLASQTCHASS